MGKVEILFDQNDRHAALPAQMGNHPANLLDDVGLDALGRLVQKQNLGAHDHGPGDRELLLLAARQIAAAAVQELFQDREQVIDLVRHPVFGFGQQGKGGFEVFADREQRKDHPPLRHHRKPAPRHFLRRRPAHFGAVDHHLAARAQMGARQRLEKAGLAHAIGAHDAGHLTGTGLKIDTVQNLAAAVMQSKALGFQHHPRPR